MIFILFFIMFHESKSMDAGVRQFANNDQYQSMITKFAEFEERLTLLEKSITKIEVIKNLISIFN